MKKDNPYQVEENSFTDESISTAHHIPLPLKIFGSLSIVAGSAVAILLGILIVGCFLLFTQGTIGSDYSTTTFVIFALETILMAILAALFAVFGVRLLLNKRRHAAQLADVMIVILIGVILCDIMLSGFDTDLVPYGLILIFLIVVQSYLDPSLSEERKLQRTLRKMETREAAEEGTLGRDESGKGFIALNFFNIFWIFTVCCVLGLILETVYHFVVVDPGHYQDRAGMLYGPLSPIYGFGAVLMTIALNRFHDKSLVVIFLVSAVVGGAFEFATSWFMEFAFGIVAWDYTGTFLSIGGRTNFMFMCMWGTLGLFWVKFCLPKMLQLVNLIPWNWRYALTTVCAALMIIDGAMTLFALDCWYQREAGNYTADSAITAYFNEHYDNEFMEERFQSMSIDPDNATRTD